jgi:hypothetical protein
VKGVDTEGWVLEFLSAFLVLGHFTLVFVLVSYLFGPILESLFLWPVSVDRNLPVHLHPLGPRLSLLVCRQTPPCMCLCPRFCFVAYLAQVCITAGTPSYPHLIRMWGFVLAAFIFLWMIRTAEMRIDSSAPDGAPNIGRTFGC